MCGVGAAMKLSAVLLLSRIIMGIILKEQGLAGTLTGWLL